MAAAAAQPKQYWLVKAEPDPRLVLSWIQFSTCGSTRHGVRRIVSGVDVSYSIEQMQKDGVADWDGVRNYQARNIMRDQMKLGDQVLYYHSNTKTPGVVGIVKVHREGYPDECAWDSSDPHFDPKTDKGNPRWFKVDLQFVRATRRLISLAELKAHPDLQHMALVKSGRLSVQPVLPVEWDIVMQLERGDAPEQPERKAAPRSGKPAKGKAAFKRGRSASGADLTAQTRTKHAAK
jgi:predicted RNA-binding protein with PUA-like domain